MGVSVTKRGVLAKDNHESHISVEVEEMTREKGLSVVTFLPTLQSLHVGVCGHLKRYFNMACDSWILSHPAKKINIAPS